MFQLRRTRCFVFTYRCLKAVSLHDRPDAVEQNLQGPLVGFGCRPLEQYVELQRARGPHLEGEFLHKRLRVNECKFVEATNQLPQLRPDI